MSWRFPGTEPSKAAGRTSLRGAQTGRPEVRLVESHLLLWMLGQTNIHKMKAVSVEKVACEGGAHQVQASYGLPSDMGRAGFDLRRHPGSSFF